MDRRDCYPESSFWETPAGHAWLIRLMVATLFGVRPQSRMWEPGPSASFLAVFAWRGGVGCSPSAMRHVMHTLERLILETAEARDQDGIAHGAIRPVIGAGDETFLQRRCWVMDLATGYSLMEEVAADRSYDTWLDRANERLTTFGTEVLYLVSDRARR